MTTLMAIGGNENHTKPILLRDFVSRAGGENADIVIFPQPSVLKQTGNEYTRLFLELGARSTRHPVAAFIHAALSLSRSVRRSCRNGAKHPRNIGWHVIW